MMMNLKVLYHDWTCWNHIAQALASIGFSTLLGLSLKNHSPGFNFE